MIDAANVSGMILQALAAEGATGSWAVVFEATVSMTDGQLAVTDAIGAWPAGPGEHAFFRLWDGVGDISDFTGPTDLADGIRLDFDPPNGENYRAGDRWFFQARAAGTDFDPSTWPNDALPSAIHYHRAPLAILTWTGAPPVALTPDDIGDCRDSFPPLTDPCPCCTITVGDGRTTHGDEDSIEAAIARLPHSGGKICLLPGLHQANAVISERSNIRITGCGKHSRVIPRPGRRDAPIFHIIDSEGIELADMEMISLGGVAVLGESTEDESLRQILVEGNRIVAGARAIQIEGGSEIVIARNRIRMLDKRDAGVAVYLASEDSRIEDNDIGVVPAQATPRPPDDPNNPEEPDDPNDPCADEDVIYGNIGFLVQFIGFIFGFTLTSIVPPPYRALGGIQIGAGAERIGVLDNRILGGAGNGITLGGSHIAPTGEEPDGPVSQSQSFSRTVLAHRGTIEDPDGNPAPGITLRMTSPSGTVRTFTSDSGGTFETQGTAEQGVHVFEPVSTGIGIEELQVVQIINLGAGSIAILRIRLNRRSDGADPRLGFVYAVRIEDNEITAMGLNGIGIPPALAVLGDTTPPPGPARGGPGTPGQGRASGSDDRFLRARAAAVNPLLEVLGNPVIDLTIFNNRIYGNLRAPFTTAMRDAARLTGFGGISLGLCETVSIIANRIEDNGLGHIDPACGIFVLFGEQVEITGNLIRDNGPFVASEAAVVPGQRGGIAGIFLSIGIDDFAAADNRGSLAVKPALRIHDNVIQQPMGRTLTILAAGPVSIVANHLAAERTGPDALDLLAGAVLLMSLSGAGRLPSGGCLINSNQIALGPESGAFIAVALAAGEDLGLDANQIDAFQSGRLIGQRILMLNTLIFAQTIRATGNRFREPFFSAELALQASLLSISTRMNTATSNQGDHCTFVFDQGSPTHLVDAGNLEYDNAFCPLLGNAAAGAALNPTVGTNGLDNIDFISNLQPPTGDALVYASALNPSLVALNEYQTGRIAAAAEHKAANAALLGNEIARLEARATVRDDILEASRARLRTMSSDVERIRAAETIVATRPVPVKQDEGFVLQGRVTDARGSGLALARVQLGDARGKVLDAVRPVETSAKGSYVLRITKDEFAELEPALKRGATMTATLEGRDIPPVTSAVFRIDKQAVLVPDIRFPFAGTTRPIGSPQPRPPTVTPLSRPVLTPAMRPRATSGRIAPLVRGGRTPRKRD